MFKKKASQDYSQKISELESTWDIKLYKKYKSLSPSEYMALIEAWDSYYDRVKRTMPAENFKTQYQAYKKGNMGLVRELAEVAKLWLREGKREQTPSEEDPRIIYRRTSVTTYENLKGVGGNKIFSI